MIILKANCESIRKQIADAGIKLCICAEFEDSVWLSYERTQVHGLGYTSQEEFPGMSVEQIVEIELSEASDIISCEYKVSEFINKIKEHAAQYDRE